MHDVKLVTWNTQACLGLDGRADPSEEYAALTAPGADGLHDAWTLAQPDRPHVATFSVHEQRYLPAPLACDFYFVTADLRHRVRQVQVDSTTRASDHQPLLLELR